MTKRTKQSRRERRIDEIIEVATEMIVDGGPDAFGVNKLAAELDLTPGALYRYFDSRDDILVAVELGVLNYFSRYFDRVEAHLEEVEPLDRVVGLVAAYVALERLRPERFRLLSRFVSSPDPVVSDASAAEVVAPTVALLGRFASAIQAAMDAGDLANERGLQRAALFWSCVQGVLDRRKLGRFSGGVFDPEPLLDELLETMLVGWGARRERVLSALEDADGEVTWNRILEETDAD